MTVALSEIILSSMKWLVVLSVFVVGCANDAPPAVPGTGTPVPPSMGSGGTGGVGGAGGRAAGACDNVADLQTLASAGSVRDVARDCGVNRCNGSSFPNGNVYETCVTSCIENDVLGLSSECAGCYGAIERCNLDSFCQLRCQLNTCSPMCLSCLNIAGCVEEFETCRGIEGTECAL